MKAAGPRKCGWCGKEGHNSQRCQHKKSNSSVLQKANEAYRSKALNWLEAAGVGPGALLCSVDGVMRNKDGSIEAWATSLGESPPVTAIVNQVTWESISCPLERDWLMRSKIARRPTSTSDLVVSLNLTMSGDGNVETDAYTSFYCGSDAGVPFLIGGSYWIRGRKLIVAGEGEKELLTLGMPDRWLEGVIT